MSPTLATVFLIAAALVLVPLGVASDLWARARRRGRLPSLPAALVLVLALVAGMHNLAFVYLGAVAGGDGLSGLNVVLALWSTMGVAILWASVTARRVRLYRTHGAPALEAAGGGAAGLAWAASARRPAGAAPASAARTGPARTGPAHLPGSPAEAGAIVRAMYRTDPSPGAPCAAPLSAARLPPTLRDLVRATPATPTMAARETATGTPGAAASRRDAARPEDASPVCRPGDTQPDAIRTGRALPDDVLAIRTPAARFAGRPIATALRGTDRADPSGTAERFRSSRTGGPERAGLAWTHG